MLRRQFQAKPFRAPTGSIHMSQRTELEPTFPSYRVVPILDAADAPVIPRVLDAEPPDALPVPVAVEYPLDVLPATPAANDDAIERIFWGLVGLPEWLFGVAALMLGLAIVAAIPILQFLSLGYLLESSARIARSGRIRDGFIGVRLGARIGGMVGASWLLLVPVRLLADMAHSAEIIAPGSSAAAGWRIGLYALITVTFFHILTACALGGKLRYFICPFNVVLLILRMTTGGYYQKARDAVWDTVVSMRLPYYFWLGLRGCVAALAWLAIPVTLLAMGRINAPLFPLVGFVGSLLLIVVLVYLPFLQLRMAQQNRLTAAFEWLAVRRDFRKAPWAFAFSFVATLAFALPLYVLKIQFVPRDVAWLPSLIFVMFIFPARLLTGWAMGRATRRATPRHWFFRWTGRLPFVPAAAFYVLILFFTQYTSWNGVVSLYEQHAFLIPVPFFGL